MPARPRGTPPSGEETRRQARLNRQLTLSLSPTPTPTPHTQPPGAPGTLLIDSEHAGEDGDAAAAAAAWGAAERVAEAVSAAAGSAGPAGEETAPLASYAPAVSILMSGRDRKR